MHGFRYFGLCGANIKDMDIAHSHKIQLFGWDGALHQNLWMCCGHGGYVCLCEGDRRLTDPSSSSSSSLLAGGYLSNALSSPPVSTSPPPPSRLPSPRSGSLGRRRPEESRAGKDKILFVFSPTQIDACTVLPKGTIYDSAKKNSYFTLKKARRRTNRSMIQPWAGVLVLDSSAFACF